MSIVYQCKSGDWTHQPARRNPDREEFYFLRYGEFSLESEIAFEKHLSRYSKLNKFYAKLNGKRIKQVLNDEPPWYGRSGLEGLY